MAVIAKPTSDAGRLSLIKTSINTANSDAAAGKSYLSSETLERAKTTEPAGYISKPFKEEDLHSNIEMALHKHRAEKKEIESPNNEE